MWKYSVPVILFVAVLAVNTMRDQTEIDATVVTESAVMETMNLETWEGHAHSHGHKHLQAKEKPESRPLTVNNDIKIDNGPLDYIMSSYGNEPTPEDFLARVKALGFDAELLISGHEETGFAKVVLATPRDSQVQLIEARWEMLPNGDQPMSYARSIVSEENIAEPFLQAAVSDRFQLQPRVGADDSKTWEMPNDMNVFVKPDYEEYRGEKLTLKGMLVSYEMRVH